MSFRGLAVRSVLLVIICAAAAVPTAGAGAKPAAKTGPCTLTKSGHKWLIAPRGLSCSDAKGVVGTLAGRSVPKNAFYPGTYEGMKCLSTSRTGTKPQYIACGSKNHSKSMVAFRQ